MCVLFLESGGKSRGCGWEEGSDWGEEECSKEECSKEEPNLTLTSIVLILILITHLW